MAVGHLANECYDRECCKQMYVLLCYSTGANSFRLSEGFEVRLDNSPLVEKGFLHEHVRCFERPWTVEKVSSARLLRAVKVRVGA